MTVTRFHAQFTEALSDFENVNAMCDWVETQTAPANGWDEWSFEESKLDGTIPDWNWAQAGNAYVLATLDESARMDRLFQMFPELLVAWDWEDMWEDWIAAHPLGETLVLIRQLALKPIAAIKWNMEIGKWFQGFAYCAGYLKYLVAITGYCDPIGLDDVGQGWKWPEPVMWRFTPVS